MPLREAYGHIIAAVGWSDISPADLGFSSESWLVAFIASDVMFEELATRAYVIERISGFTGSHSYVWRRSVVPWPFTASTASFTNYTCFDWTRGMSQHVETPSLTCGH